MAEMKQLGIKLSVMTDADRAKQQITGVKKELTSTKEAVSSLKSAAEQHQKVLQGFKSVTEAYFKSYSEGTDKATAKTRTFADVAKASFGAVVSSAGKAIEVFNKFDHSLHATQGRWQQLKGVFTGGFVGDVGYNFIKHALAEAKGDAAAESKLKRMFGKDAERLIELGERLGERMGVGASDAQQALVPLASVIANTMKGSKYRGKKLTEAQAEALRSQTTEVAASQLERLTVMTGRDPADVAWWLSMAGGDPRMLPRFARRMGINPVLARQIVDADKKKKLYDLLGEDVSKQLGIEKGKAAPGTGTLLEALLTKGGFTKEATDKKRMKWDFQMQALEATYGETLGEIGKNALKQMNEQLGKGVPLAQRLRDYLKSEDGKKTIEAISSAVTAIVSNVVKLVQYIPKVAEFLTEHKGTILAIGATYAGLKVTSGVVDVAKGVKSDWSWVIDLFKRKGKGGLAGALGDAAGHLGGDGVVKVFVTNWPGGFGGSGMGGGEGTGGIGDKIKTAGKGALTAVGDKLVAVAPAAAAPAAVGGVILGQAYALSKLKVDKAEYEREAVQGGFGTYGRGLDTSRADRVRQIVAAFERAGTDDPRAAMKEMGVPLTAAINSDKGLQAVVQSIISGKQAGDLPPELAKALAANLKGSGVVVEFSGDIRIEAPITEEHLDTHVMPAIRDRLARDIRNRSAGGAAKVSRR